MEINIQFQKSNKNKYKISGKINKNQHINGMINALKYLPKFYRVLKYVVIGQKTKLLSK